MNYYKDMNNCAQLIYSYKNNLELGSHLWKDWKKNASKVKQRLQSHKRPQEI